MIQDIFKYLLIFIMFMALQVYVLDNLPVIADTRLFEKSRPVIFFFFLLLLPEMPAWAILLVGFFTGLIYDSFYYTYGVNASACVLVAYARLPLLRFFKPDDDEGRFSAHIHYLGFSRFLTFIAAISFIFHFSVTFLDVFSFSEGADTLLRAIIGTFFSVLLIYLLDIIFFYRKPAS